MPKQHMVHSSNYFIQIATLVRKSTHMPSLYVEQLFTNVPVNETTDIIMECVYRHEEILKPKSNDGTLFLQVDGVSMASQLGPNVANQYKDHLEKKAFHEILIIPDVYCCYVDNSILLVRNPEEFYVLINYFQTQSRLRFTFELELKNKLTFLGFTIQRDSDQLETAVFTKETNKNECLNYIQSVQDFSFMQKFFFHKALSL